MTAAYFLQYFNTGLHLTVVVFACLFSLLSLFNQSQLIVTVWTKVYYLLFFETHMQKMSCSHLPI